MNHPGGRGKDGDIDGQPHDRIPVEPVVHETQSGHDISPNGGPVPDVTLSQKMLSAVSGSILTSILVTPLDVVRVRLQSQQPVSIPAPLDPKTFAGSSLPRTNFANLPPNLGVTACCREVFWVNNNAEYCLAGEVGHAGALSASTPSSPAQPGEQHALNCAVEAAERKTFNSTFDGLRKIARNEGLTTLWRGLAPTLMMAVPGNVIYFAGYDWLRTSSRSPLAHRVPDAYSPLVAGSFARVLAALFVSPIELFRVRMQASQTTSAAQNFHDTLTGVKEMTARHGYRSLWRGLTLTLWRDVPFSAFYWWGYEAVRNSLLDLRIKGDGISGNDIGASMTANRGHSRSQQNHANTMVDSFVAGAASGALASIVTTPFDVGKTRQQVYKYPKADEAAASLSANRAKGVAGVVRPEERSMPRLLWHIFKCEGFEGLFKGWIPRTLKVAPACAIMISSYEMGKRMALGANEENAELQRRREA